MHKLDIASILSLIVGLSSIVADSAFQTQLTSLFGIHAPQIAAAMGLAGLVASQVLRVVGSPSGTVQTPQILVPAPPAIDPAIVPPVTK